MLVDRGEVVSTTPRTTVGSSSTGTWRDDVVHVRSSGGSMATVCAASHLVRSSSFCLVAPSLWAGECCSAHVKICGTTLHMLGILRRWPSGVLAA